MRTPFQAAAMLANPLPVRAAPILQGNAGQGKGILGLNDELGGFLAKIWPGHQTAKEREKMFTRNYILFIYLNNN
jgi:hypothetical protein